MRKTATIERYHVYGTPRHHVRATYRGHTVNYWQQGDCRPEHVYLDAVHCFGIDEIELLHEWRKRLKGLGFTHVRFDGAWGKHNTKPKGGKL